MLVAIAVGALIGYLASRYWRAAQSRQFDNLLIGMIGGFLGNRIFESIGGQMGQEVTENMNLQLSTAAFGAVVLIIGIKLVRKKPSTDKEDGINR